MKKPRDKPDEPPGQSGDKPDKKKPPKITAPDKIIVNEKG